MNMRPLILSLFGVIGLTTSLLAACSEEPESTEATWAWNLPARFPTPSVPADNPMNAQKVELGRMLFYEPLLSRDQSMSCASCHFPERAFTDGRQRPSGILGEELPRNSMTLTNAVYNSSLTWAGPHLKTLEEHAMIPLFASLPTELGNREFSDLEDALRGARDYSERFVAAFPGEESPLRGENVLKALGAFQRTIISSNAPYDRFLDGDRDALSPEAKRGMELFFSEKFECFHCHGGFNFASSVNHEGQIEATSSFHNNGLYNLDATGAYPASDQGLYDVTGKDSDRGLFRAPTLRNIAVTGPYMHDGSVETLEEVINIYARGGRLIEEGPYAGDGALNPNRSSFVLGFRLRDTELTDLVAFLHALTDESFLTNPALQSPFDEAP